WAWTGRSRRARRMKSRLVERRRRPSTFQGRCLPMCWVCASLDLPNTTMEVAVGTWKDSLAVLALVLAAWLLAAAPGHAYTVFVSNEKDNTISVIDSEKLEVTKT